MRQHALGMRPLRSVRRLVLALLAIAALTLAGRRPAAAAPEGTLTFAMHFSPVPRWLDPAEGESTITPVSPALRAARRAAQAHARRGLRRPSLAESWSMAQGQAERGLHAAAGREVPQRRSGHRRRREVLLRALPGRRRQGAQGQRQGDPDRSRPNRVRFVFKEPWPDFPAFYGTFVASAGWVVPQKYVERVGEEGFRKAPVGAGPYKFVSFNPGVELVLEAFEGYWRKTPSIKRIVFRSLPDETTRAAALKSGEVDLAYAADRARPRRTSSATAGMRLVAPLLGIFWLDFPDQWDPKSPWADRRVRLAASLAVDRQALNEAETLGLSRPTGSTVPRDFEFALPLRAAALRPGAGQEAPGRGRLSRTASTPASSRRSRPTTRWARRSQGWLQAVGIRTRMRTMERGAFMTALAREEAARRRAHDQRRVRQRGHPPRVVRHEERRLRLRGAAGGRRPLPPPGQGARQEEARGAAAPDAEGPARPGRSQAPIYHLGFPIGVGPRVDDIMATAIPGFYMSPYEDLKLRRPQ